MKSMLKQQQNLIPGAEFFHFSRVQDEVLDVTVNGFKVVETKEITGSDNAEMLNECVDENARRKIRNIYGLKDNEVESITEDDDYNDDVCIFELDWFSLQL